MLLMVGTRSVPILALLTHAFDRVASTHDARTLDAVDHEKEFMIHTCLIRATAY
jgi:hypothetical protein